MNQVEAQQRIEQLTSELNQHNYNYYVESNPTITDYEFDLLLKELQDLEMNQLIKRTVLNTKPLTVEYELTACGKTLGPIIDEIAKWGITYRSTLYTKNETEVAMN